VQALVGTFDVGKVVDAEPKILWDQVKDIAGINRKQFDDYYTGATKAYGIFVQEVRQLPKPVWLGSLRGIFDSFHPPQSYRYVTPVEAAAINSTSHEIMKRDLLQRMPACVR
jgi:predicted transcriptional regulator